MYIFFSMIFCSDFVSCILYLVLCILYLVSCILYLAFWSSWLCSRLVVVMKPNHALYLCCSSLMDALRFALACVCNMVLSCMNFSGDLGDIILCVGVGGEWCCEKRLHSCTHLFDPSFFLSFFMARPESWKVGKYFDVEGYFDEWGMGDVAERLVQKLEKKIKDRAKKKEKKEKWAVGIIVFVTVIFHYFRGQDHIWGTLWREEVDICRCLFFCFRRWWKQWSAMNKLDKRVGTRFCSETAMSPLFSRCDRMLLLIPTLMKLLLFWRQEVCKHAKFVIL